MVNPIIETKNLSVIYNKGKSNEVRSLANINVKIYPQEYVIIYGPSGCGKSTLLYSIAGLQLPTDGEAIVNGKSIGKMNKKEMVELHQVGIGMIFQAFYLISSIKILENVCLPRVFCGDSAHNRREAGMKLLRRFGIVEQGDKFPSQLSGGQKQRVAIARSLINNPEIILADEPVGNLDSESSENVMNILKDLNEQDKKTVILVTHNAEHLHFADRVIYMKDGEVVSEEINRDKRPKEVTREEVIKEPDKISNELKLLMRVFKNFSPQQSGGLLVPYKSKQLMYHVILELTDEQLQMTESLLRELLFKNSDIQKFQNSLDMSLEKGGAGLNKLRSKSFASRVGEILEQVAVLEHDLEKAPVSLADYFIRLFQLPIDIEERSRLISFLRMRIQNKVDCFGLQERLDAPFAVGGVGLYRSTAERVVKEMEMIMLLKFTGQ